jgi:hypothetical protein
VIVIVIVLNALDLAKHLQQRIWSIFIIFRILKAIFENGIDLICCHFDWDSIDSNMIEIEMELWWWLSWMISMLQSNHN